MAEALSPGEIGERVRALVTEYRTAMTDGLLHDLAQARQVLADREAELDAVRRDRSTLADIACKRTRERDDAERRRACLAGELSDARRERDVLRERVGAVEAERARLAAAVEKTGRERDVLRERVGAVEAERARLWHLAVEVIDTYVTDDAHGRACYRPRCVGPAALNAWRQRAGMSRLA